MDVLVSNGFSRFQLVVAAAEASKRGRLARLVTGAYPSPRVVAFARQAKLTRLPRILRLFGRGEELPDAAVVPAWGAESLHLLARLAARSPALRDATPLLDSAAMRLYGRRARLVVRGLSGAAVYHYRAGFGRSSLAVARRRGMVLLCDHSIAHPAVLERLLADRGRMPSTPVPPPQTRLWREVLADIEAADAVVVNSDFVKETFVLQGWDPQRVHVVYWGVDDGFLRLLPKRGPRRHGPLRLLFAGTVEARKGTLELGRALGSLEDLPWSLTVVGPVAAGGTASLDALPPDRVLRRGQLAREGLAAEMARADVFVFPSLAEGSARVVFEALAAGCYVVTTANAGSIVRDGVHGMLVPPGESEALARALRRVIELDPSALAAAGSENARLIRTRYRQRDYGRRLDHLYRAVSESA